MKEVYISTGQKQVMHTMWVENIVERPNPSINTPSRIPMMPAFIQDIYIKNLSMNEDEAIKEAKEYANANGAVFAGVSDSPRFKRAKTFEAFGIHFIQRRKKGKTFFVGKIPTQEFWDAWRNNKEEMKKTFSVSKFKNPIKKSEEWYIFYKEE